MGVWLREIHKNNITAVTYDRYLASYDQIVKEFGHVRVAELNTIMIQEYINQLNIRRCSRSTMNKILSLLKIYYKYLISMHTVTYNPTFGVIIPNEKTVNKKTKQVQALTKEEQEKFLSVAFSCCKNGKPRYRYRYLYLLLMNTGLRIGEAIALTKTDVDMEHRLIHVRSSISMVRKEALDKNELLDTISTKYVMVVHDTKTKTSERDIPMNDAAYEAAEHILKYCSAKNSFLFVTTKEGGVVNTRSINQNLIAIAKQAGISQFGVHTLRHTFGTNLSDAEVPSREIADLMGHRYTTVTQKYIHKDVEHLRKAITKI